MSDRHMDYSKKPGRRFVWAIDFDGTIVENRFPEIGPEVSLCIESIRAVKEFCGDDICIAIWTCRNDIYEAEAKEWLDAHGVPYDYLNEGPPECEWGQRKIFYDHLTDDRAGFTGWLPERVRVLNKFTEWCDKRC